MSVRHNGTCQSAITRAVKGDNVHNFSLAFELVLVSHKKNSVALVRKRTIPTERPPPVGEVSANFCG